MKRSNILSLLGSACLLSLTACETTYHPVEKKGVPRWLEEGAKLNKAPQGFPADADRINWEKSRAPIKYSIPFGEN